MTLKEQVLAQAAMLAGELEGEQLKMLDVLCGAATASLLRRLRDGLSVNDCKADFVAAASLYALAALNDVLDGKEAEQVVAGDLTVRRGSADAASRCLFRQAELMITPYLKDRFLFMGV